jgi:hypothetical protein
MQQWTVIYRVTSLPEASIIKGMLEENQVPVVVVNKQDSSYLNFGEIELHVPVHLKHLAQQLVNKVLSN